MPGWFFRLRDWLLWLALILLMLVAVSSLGLFAFFLSDGPISHGARFFFGAVFGRMPMILLGLAVLGVAFALFDFRMTARGYKRSLIIVGLIFVVMVLLAGWTFNRYGLSRNLDSFFSNARFYQDREMYMRQVWQDPDNGLLAGQIASVAGNETFYMKDFDGKEWKVEISHALRRHGLAPVEGLKIKLIGSALGNIFVADEIRPWMGMGGCRGTTDAKPCGMLKQ